MKTDYSAHRHVAQELTGMKVISLDPIHGNGNNRLYRVRSAGGEQFALKFYLRQPGDLRDRLGVETGVIGFLRDHGVTAVPRLIAMDKERGCALLEWIEGVSIIKPSGEDINIFSDFVGTLHQLSSQLSAQTLPMASAACLSGAVIEEQIYVRLARLEKIVDNHAELASFIRTNFVPMLQRTVTDIRDSYQRSGLDYSTYLPLALRILSPSDFGLHNAILTSERGLVFLDFEYFGWDDPVKLVSDFLFHPGMISVSLDIKKRFVHDVIKILRSDATFCFRLKQLLPLFGLCWCLIILNEFLPEVWQRRIFASERGKQEAVQAEQLIKSQQLLASLHTTSRSLLE